MKIEIMPGCIECGACSAINNEIFELTDSLHIHQDKISGCEEDCKAAADACPVNVIKIIED